MKAELNKLFRGKLMLGLIVLSVVLNAALLFMQRDKIHTLQSIDKFGAEYGSTVSDETLKILEQIWNEEPGNDISWVEFQNNLECSKVYYQSLQSSDMANAYCNLMRLEGKAAEYVQDEFAKSDSRIQDAAEQEVTVFPPYRMRIFDFITTYLLFAVNLEGVIAAVILTLYVIDMERSSGTASTVYSTKKGKRILRDKLLAAFTGSLLSFFLIVVLTFLPAAFLFPTETILNTMVSNPMVNLKGVPCIAKAAITIGEYIAVSLFMSSILVGIYSLGSFAVGIRAKNGYFAVGILMILLGIMRVFSSVAPTSTYLFFWSQYNPLDIALKAGTWFLYNANNFSPSGYEVYTVLLWGGVSVTGCISGLRRFEKRRLKG